jgi:hypothetical protein
MQNIDICGHPQIAAVNLGGYDNYIHRVRLLNEPFITKLSAMKHSNFYHGDGHAE